LELFSTFEQKSSKSHNFWKNSNNLNFYFIFLYFFVETYNFLKFSGFSEISDKGKVLDEKNVESFDMST
jgi:hypothetical protein